MAKNNDDHILRHSLEVRINHWLVAISGLVLVFSGMGELPMYKRYGLVNLPGLSWAGDFWLQLDIHYYAAIVFMVAIFFHGVYHFRRREFNMLPRRGDFKESVEIIHCMVTGKEEPQHCKFLAEQRLAYAAIGVVSLVLILTGLIKAFKNTGPIVLDPTFLTVVTMIHTVTTMIFLLLFVAHLGAFLIKANRPLLTTMFHGRLHRDYVAKRHGKWDH